MLEHSTQYLNWCFVNKEKQLEEHKQQKITKYRKIYQKVLNKNPQAEIQVRFSQKILFIYLLSFLVLKMKMLFLTFTLHKSLKLPNLSL